MTPATGPVGAMAAAPRRSNAVTAIGVVFLTGGLMWLVGALFQGAFFVFLSSMRPAGIGLGDVATDANVPSGVRFMLRYAKFFWALNVAASAALAICSAGLLFRRRWARVAILFVAGAGVVYALGSLSASALMVPFFRARMAGLESLGVGGAMTAVATIALAIVVVKSLLLAGFFAWMVWKLTRPEVRAEFG